MSAGTSIIGFAKIEKNGSNEAITTVSKSLLREKEPDVGAGGVSSLVRVLVRAAL
jgi:hypothetical protein